MFLQPKLSTWSFLPVAIKPDNLVEGLITVLLRYPFIFYHLVPEQGGEGCPFTTGWHRETNHHTHTHIYTYLSINLNPGACLWTVGRSRSAQRKPRENMQTPHKKALAWNRILDLAARQQCCYLWHMWAGYKNRLGIAAWCTYQSIFGNC